MPRVNRGVASRARRKKVLKAAKGYYGARSRSFKVAKQAVIKAGQYAYRDRRQRKRQFRALWIVRINAAANELGISYSRLIDGLKKASKRKRQLRGLEAVAKGDIDGLNRMLPTKAR